MVSSLPGIAGRAECIGHLVFVDHEENRALYLCRTLRHAQFHRGDCGKLAYIRAHNTCHRLGVAASALQENEKGFLKEIAGRITDGVPRIFTGLASGHHRD